MNLYYKTRRDLAGFDFGGDGCTIFGRINYLLFFSIWIFFLGYNYMAVAWQRNLATTTSNLEIYNNNSNKTPKLGKIVFNKQEAACECKWENVEMD